MQEIELKFLVPNARLKGLMRQVKIKAATTTPMAAHYFDTPDQDLANAGIGLRIRREGDQWVQTIKAGGDGIAARLEHNVALDDEQVKAMLDTDTLMPDLSIYKDTAIASALKDFKLKKLAKKLERQYVTDIERTTRLLVEEPKVYQGELATSNIEVAYDVGHIIHGRDDTQQKSIQEIEFELIDGDIDYLFETAKVWCKRYKLCLSTVTKAEHGGLLINGQDFSKAQNADLSALTIEQDISAPAFVRAITHNCLLQILPNSSAIAAGSTHTDHVLQLHIGLQRLRVALKAFKKLNDDINPDWYPIIKQTATLLSEYHHLADINTRIQPMLEAKGAPPLDLPSEDIKKTKVTPIDAVRANDFQLTLLELIAFTMNSDDKISNSNDKDSQDKDNSDDAETVSNQPLATDDLPKILSKYHDKLLIDKAADDGDTLNESAKFECTQKQLRRITDMRYLSEFAAPLYDKKKTKRWLKRLNKAQKSLGNYADTERYYDYYQKKSAKDDSALFGAGWFAATLQTDDKRCQKQLGKLKDTKTFW